MALKGGTRFEVPFEAVFPAGCALVPDSITEAQDYNPANGARTPSIDKVSGLRVWTVRVVDLDPELGGRSHEVAVKISAPVQPVPDNGAPFAPVEFEGLSVTPYVAQNGRLAYSLRATGFRTPTPGGDQA
ncbi:transcriptional regulator [Dactylosporangium sp. CA-092794]|uniref:transcriptional regulator n=1 Tax=Dactylosporangium sp. CA-092794 TaxID=3239929 RepID=UPI003D92037F